MLVLSRKVNEAIVVDDNIRITVVGIRGNQIRLGIEAPEWIKIYRDELCVPARVIAEGEDPANEGVGVDHATDLLDSPATGLRSRLGSVRGRQSPAHGTPGRERARRDAIAAAPMVHSEP